VPDPGKGDELMKNTLLAFAAFLVALGATGASAATRAIGAGCCPLCK